MQPLERLREVVVQLVHGILLLGGHRPESTVSLEHGPQTLADDRVVGKVLRQNVHGTLQGFLHGLHTLLRVYILRRQLFRALTEDPSFTVLAGEKQFRQGFQTLLPSHSRPGAALGPIGPVQVLHLSQGGRPIDGLRKLGGQLALLLHSGFDLLSPVFQSPEIGQTIRQFPDGLVVHGAMTLLPVTGDKGHGIALIQKLHHSLCVLRPYVEFLG
ncbi:putative uncharacterized protein [Clostridium sp. CAG:1013]|nr:putative uncharacterized protein [Clostridium sp. CAG:1013]